MGTFFTNNERILKASRKLYNMSLWISSIISDAKWNIFKWNNEKFCNTVEATGKTCHFCKCTKGCRADKLAIRYQIVTETTKDTIQEKVMLKDWNLIDLCTNSMKYESAAAGEEKISGV